MKRLFITAFILSTISSITFANDGIVYAPQVSLAMNNTNSRSWPALAAEKKQNNETVISEQQLEHFSHKMNELTNRINNELDKLIAERIDSNLE